MSNANAASADPAATLSTDLDALLERRAAECPESWKETAEVATAHYYAIKAMREEIGRVRTAGGYVAPAPALRVYPVTRRDDGPGYVVDVVGGPGSLLWRATEKAALEDGASYVSAHYHQTAKGQWFAV